MKEKLLKLNETVKSFWASKTKSQKGVFLGSSVIVIVLIASLSFLVFNAKYVPLYKNLSMQEVGQVKEELDARGVSYELENGGATILVPEDQADSLIVDLAGQGIPKSGSIDYSFFSENSSWGITDNEFNIMKLDAMQTELANLIKGIEGINDANVMITIPEETVFVSESIEEASAAIILNTQPGYEFEGNQVESLYHLVSKAVPNLLPENILIQNQYFEYFDSISQPGSGNLDDYTYQQTVKKDTERDIQRRLQQMIGAMVGMDSVIVSVTADIDFTKENRVEELVDPVDLDNMEGLPVSIETVHETYSGNPGVGGVAGVGDEDIANYNAIDGSEDGDYELIKETINNEFNRIRKEIVESPFKIRDLGIQVAVNNMMENDGAEVQLLSQQEQSDVEAGITSILSSMIGTSIDKEYGEVVPDEKISIVFQPFSGKKDLASTKITSIPLWMYIAGAVLLIVIVILVVILVRSRRAEEYDEIITEEIAFDQISEEIPAMAEVPDTESDIRKKQLEKMAMDKPEDFAKLLKSWIADD